MRTRILQVALTLGVIGLFGYIAYKDLIFDGAASAETQLAAVMTKPAAVAPNHQPTKEEISLKRAQIALQEYRKNVVETTRGCNCGPEIDKYTEGHAAQWCAMFVSWITKEAGTPLWSEKSKSWRVANSREMASYLEQHGTWHSREEIIQKGLTPQVGDIVIFWRGNFEDKLGHADVVVALGETPGSADLIGGNIQSRVKYRDNFPYLKNYGFLGFGHPEK